MSSELKKKVKKNKKMRSKADEELGLMPKKKTDNEKSTKADDNVQEQEEESSGIMTETSFKSLGVCEALCEACEKLGWKNYERISKI